MFSRAKTPKRLVSTMQAKLPISIIKYLYTKIIHNIESSPQENLTSLKDEHKELVRSGICILPNYFSKEIAHKMYSHFKELSFIPTPEMRHGKDNPLGDKCYDKADEIELFKEFFFDPKLISLIKSYIPKETILHKALAREKSSTSPVDSFENFIHFDSYKKRLKVFMLLTDVEEQNAPTSYLIGSHKLGIWRLRHEFEMFCLYKKDDNQYASDQESAYLGCYWPHESKNLSEKYKFRQLTCVGSAGTVIVFDGQGLHVANQLFSGSRAVLVGHWIQRNHHM